MNSNMSSKSRQNPSKSSFVAMNVLPQHLHHYFVHDCHSYFVDDFVDFLVADHRDSVVDCADDVLKSHIDGITLEGPFEMNPM